MRDNEEEVQDIALTHTVLHPIGWLEKEVVRAREKGAVSVRLSFFVDATTTRTNLTFIKIKSKEDIAEAAIKEKKAEIDEKKAELAKLQEAYDQLNC